MSEEGNGKCEMVAKPSESEPVTEEGTHEEAPVKALSSVAIMKADDSELVRLDVAQWGGAVYVRSLTCAERDELERFTKSKKGDTAGFNVFLARMTTCDECGNALFSKDDEAWLAKKNARVLERICRIAISLSGIGEEEDELSDFQRGQKSDSGSG
jgi:hypothetical protein